MILIILFGQGVIELQRLMCTHVLLVLCAVKKIAELQLATTRRHPIAIAVLVLPLTIVEATHSSVVKIRAVPHFLRNHI